MIHYGGVLASSRSRIRYEYQYVCAVRVDHASMQQIRDRRPWARARARGACRSFARACVTLMQALRLLLVAARLTHLPAAPPHAVTGYDWRPGRLVDGVQLLSGRWTRLEAEERCSALPACNGFSFQWNASNFVPPIPSTAVDTILSNATFGQGNWRLPAWHSFVKQTVPDPLCPTLHPIKSAGVFDPSGGLQSTDGMWHTFEDSGGWFHYESADLIRWQLSSAPTTGFHIHGGMTGSVSRLPGGGFAAFLPNANQTGLWRSASDDLTTWQHPPTTPIKAPPGSNGNFRDPGTAMEVDGKHFIPVGCGSESGAEVSWQLAIDDKLTKFQLAGNAPGSTCGGLLVINETLGHKDNLVQWHQGNLKATMAECPDVFQASFCSLARSPACPHARV